jgi:hypothetical protein
VVLTADEGAKIRTLVREKGAKEAARALGLCDVRAVMKAAIELPIARLTAEVIRGRLDRI